MTMVLLYIGEYFELYAKEDHNLGSFTYNYEIRFQVKPHCILRVYYPV